MSRPSYLPNPNNLPKGFPTPSPDGTIRPRFFAYPHLRAMWPIMLSGAFVMWKFFENFNAQELKKASEADFEQSFWLKQMRIRGVRHPVFPEWTGDEHDEHDH